MRRQPTGTRTAVLAPAAALLLALLAVLFLPAAAGATDPVTLGSGHVLDQAGVLSDTQAAQAENRIEQQIQPRLASGDWTGAVDAAATGLTSTNSSGGGAVGWIIAIVAIVAIVIVIVWLLRRRRSRGTAGAGAPSSPALGDEFDGLATPELAQRAASALIATDDAIKTSAQELDFARAQFGDDATAEFVTALAQARDGLDQAFALKQQLDDDIPDTEAQTRTWNVQIIRLCRDAGQVLDEKAAAFDELRRLEQNAPEALTHAQQQRATVAAALEGAEQRLHTLQAAYAPEALATVADNITQAHQRLAFADQQLAAAQTAIGAGDGGGAAVALRAAEQAIDQTKLLEDAIDRLAADLADGERNAAALIQELRGDIAAARALPDPDGRVATAVAATQAQVDAATADAAGTQKHPLAALHALEESNRQIDAVVSGARDAAAQAERDRQLLGQVMAQARAQVSAAEDYVTARRGAVGVDARTRLAQAGAELTLAQQATDAGQAMSHARRADQLAGSALQLAQQDVGGFAPGAIPGMTGATGGRGGGDMLGAVLGGILVSSLLGGGRGGRSSGGGLGGGFGGSPGGGLGPGSFGGGGTRGRRGGGRF